MMMMVMMTTPVNDEKRLFLCNKLWPITRFHPNKCKFSKNIHSVKWINTVRQWNQNLWTWHISNRSNTRIEAITYHLHLKSCGCHPGTIKCINIKFYYIVCRLEFRLHTHMYCNLMFLFVETNYSIYFSNHLYFLFSS